MAAAPMGCESESVQEPGVVSDARSEAARVVLRAGERLEVVVVDGLAESGQRRDAELVQQLSVPAEASDPLGHGAGSTPRDPGDLPVGGAVDEAPRDRDGQFGTLEVVTRREGLLREALTAHLTDESGNDPSVAAPGVGLTKPPVAE